MKGPKILSELLSKMGVMSRREDREILKELLVVKLDEAGTLSRHVDEPNRLRVSRMKIEGDLDSTDVGILRSMPNLENLDLSDARIIVGGDYYIKSLYCQNENDAMGLYMFHRHAKLRSILFPKDVRFVRAFAFRRCTALTEVHFSNVLESIGERAFSYCESLEELRFPATLKQIRLLAFVNCKSLKTLVLPDSVESIDYCAFGNCTALTSATLSSSLKDVGTEVFKGCDRLVSVHVRGTEPAFAKSDAFDGLNLDTCTLYVPKGTRARYSMANGWKNFKHIVEE